MQGFEGAELCLRLCGKSFHHLRCGVDVAMVDSLHKCIPLFEIAFAGLIEIGLYESLPD